jgi:uncharacterized protein
MVRKNKNKVLIYLIAVLILIFILNLFGLFLVEKKAEEKEVIVYKESAAKGNYTLVKMKLPAVDSEGNGVSTTLSVEASKGTGRTLVDIENLLFWADTQHSIRMARLVADDFTNESVEEYDLIYNVEANASIIGGPSAGAALTLATIFALRGKQPREDVMITGTINHDGSIGPVSAILEKAKASRDAGASIFLVPLLQSRDVVYETKKHCEEFGGFEVCQTETIPKKINVGEEADIEVIEVGDIEEALEYFTP